MNYLSAKVLLFCLILTVLLCRVSGHSLHHHQATRQCQAAAQLDVRDCMRVGSVYTTGDESSRVIEDCWYDGAIAMWKPCVQSCTPPLVGFDNFRCRRLCPKYHGKCVPLVLAPPATTVSTRTLIEQLHAEHAEMMDFLRRFVNYSLNTTSAENEVHQVTQSHIAVTPQASLN